VFDGDPATPGTEGTTTTTQFLAHIYCGQTAGWMKTPLGTEVYLGPGHIVLDGVPAAQNGHNTPPHLFGPCLLWPRSPISATAKLLLKMTVIQKLEQQWVQGMELRNFHRGCHIYLAGRPSRWASALILGIHVYAILYLHNDIFGRPKMVRPMLPDRCLSVCNVGVLWPNGWMDQGETWPGGRPQPWPHCVRWRRSSPSP